MDGLSTTRLLVLLMVVLIAGGGVALVFYPYPLYDLADRFGLLTDEQKQERSFREMSRAVESFWNADYQSAAEGAQAVLERGESDPMYFSALVLSTDAQVKVGNTQEERIAALTQVKQLYDQADSPANQAFAINSLLYALDSFSPQVIESVFSTGEPFASLYSADRETFVRNLALHAISLYPTTVSHLQLARLDADALLLSIEPGTTVLRDNTLAGRQAAEERVERIVQEVRAAEALIDAELTFAPNSPLGIMFAPRYHFWRGYALAAAGRIDEQYAPQAVASLLRVTQIFNAARDEEGRRHERLLPIATFSRFTLARLLLAVTGEDKQENLRTNVTAFVSLLANDTTGQLVLVRRFIDGLGRVAQNPPTPEWEEGVGGYWYKEYLALARVSPELKTYLENVGWKL